MTITLVADEFGLLHAAVPHPLHPQKNIQVMVLQAEDGWWAYVDGQRVEGTFMSAQQAGRASASAIAALHTATNAPLASTRRPAVHRIHPAVTERALSAQPRRTRRYSLSGSAVAAVAAVAFLGVTAFVVKATGALEGVSVGTRVAQSQVAEVSLAPPSNDTIELWSPDQPELAPVKRESVTSGAAAHIDAAQATGSFQLQSAPGRVTTIAPLPAVQPIVIEPKRVETPVLVPKVVHVATVEAAPQPIPEPVIPAAIDEALDSASFARRTDDTDVDVPLNETRVLSPDPNDPDDVEGLTGTDQSVSKPRRTTAATRRSQRVRRTVTRRRAANRRRRVASFRALRSRRIHRLRSRSARRSWKARKRRAKRIRIRRVYRAAFGRQ